jgi:hypothetical protein
MADYRRWNNIRGDVDANKFTRVACRDGTNRRLRLSLLEKKGARSARKSVGKRRGCLVSVESGFGIFQQMMGWMRRHLDGGYVRVGQQTGRWMGTIQHGVNTRSEKEKGRARAGCQRLEGGRI